MKRQFTKGNIKMTNMHKKILYISSYQRYMQKETTNTQKNGQNVKDW